MVIDYKNVSFSFKRRKRDKFVRRLKVLFIIIIVVFSYFLFKSIIESKKISEIQNLLLQNKTAQAANLLNEIENTIFYRKSKKELAALIFLFQGKLAKAETILSKLSMKKSAIEYLKFLDHFTDLADYQKLKIYTDFLLKTGHRLSFHQALYKTAFFDFQASSEIISDFPPNIRKKFTKSLKILETANKSLQSGKINYIYDINGQPLAYFDCKTKETHSLAPGINFDGFGKNFEKGIKSYKLTLDLNIQNLIHRLFDKHFGSFILLNVNDNSIIAAYSKPSKKQLSNTVFSQRYEPGSIIKILTLFAYLNSSLDKLFPLYCQGQFVIDGKVFRDWFAHKKVDDYQECLIVSCNICFAKMSMSIGFPRLAKIFEKFYFNVAGFKDLFLSFKTGRFPKKISSDHQLARLAVGLDSVTITTFHAALISAIISQNGSVFNPFLIKNIKNVLNLAYYNYQAKLANIIKENTIFYKIKQAMIETVQSNKGTAKRARVSFMKVGAKTGTAGIKKYGLDSILLGFFPADKPEYAFAYRLERAGRADLAGARFLKNFLINFYDQNKQ